MTVHRTSALNDPRYYQTVAEDTGEIGRQNVSGNITDYLTEQTNNTEMTSKLLFKDEKFDDFNPNKCNLGYKLFNNHTRIQLRDL